MISYTSDITTAQQQTNTYIAEMKKNGATDATCFCDPIAPVFSSKGEEEQNYHPENVGTGSGLLDYDVLAQLYDQDVWRHTFGLSNIGNALPFEQSDAVKAWHDVGNSGRAGQDREPRLHLLGVHRHAADGGRPEPHSAEHRGRRAEGAVPRRQRLLRRLAVHARHTRTAPRSTSARSTTARRRTRRSTTSPVATTRCSTGSASARASSRRRSTASSRTGSVPREP